MDTENFGMDTENFGIEQLLAQHKLVIEKMLEKQDAQDDLLKALNEQIVSMQEVIVNEILTPANEAMKQAEYEARFETFAKEFGEKLSVFDERLRAIEGDDFSLARKAFDEYNAIEGDEKPTEAEFVDGLIENVGAQLEHIKEVLNVPADAEVSIKEGKDGEPVVEVDGVEIVEADEVASDPAEVEAYEKELEAQLDKSQGKDDKEKKDE